MGVNEQKFSCADSNANLYRSYYSYTIDNIKNTVFCEQKNIKQKMY